ncbi:MAG: tetratricopeptide repeat protein [Spirochaetes bacterium]|nr:tetratricopeptide repeat protein [Spirochaetota bacterium]
MKKFIWIIFIMIITAGSSGAAILETYEIPTSVRAIGMGETFTAIANDSTALRFNPAGLAQIKHSELHGMFGTLYGSGLYNSYVALAIPIQKINTVAIDWLYTGFSEEDEFTVGGIPELGYGEHMLYLGWGRKFPHEIYGGISLKYYNVNVSYDDETWAQGQGLGADIGGLWKINPQIAIGLVLKNVWPLKVHYESGSPQTILNPNLSLGVAYNPIKPLIVGMDLNDSLHLGAEYWLFNIVALRAGFIKGLAYENNDNFGLSAGGGLRYKFAQLDYAFSHNSDLPATHRFSATLSWGFRAYLVDVISIHTEDIYANQYKSYAGRDTVRVVVKNKTKKAMDTTIGVYVPDLMEGASAKKITLQPGIPTEITLPMIFSDSVMEVTDDSSRTAEVIVSYDLDDRTSQDVTPGNFLLYNRNAFVWTELDKIAAFITPQDESISRFSRQVLQSVSVGKIRDRFISDNFYKAIILFEALGNQGITYIADPNRPLFVTSGENASVDYIQYPVETLDAKSGDCDDATVLFASCLENVGVDTILIDVPGHVFMMFDAGLTSSEAAKKFSTDDLYVELEGKVWVPIEPTMFQQGFNASWQEACTSLKKWSDEQANKDEEILRLSHVRSAWRKYPSATIPDESVDTEVEQQKLKQEIGNEIDKFLSSKDQEYNQLLEEYKLKPDDIKLNNQTGIYYAKNGLYTYAAGYFNHVLELDNKNTSAYNNLGNLYLMMGEYEKAIDNYEQALKIDPDNSKAIKNLNWARSLKKMK